MFKKIRIFRDTLLSVLVFVNENCCPCKCFIELYFSYWLWEVSFAILIALLFVFISQTWTSHVRVLKTPMPRVSNAFFSFTKPYINKRNNKHKKFFIMLKRSSFNVHSNTRQLLALQIWRLSKVRTGWLYIKFWIFFHFLTKSALLPCIPHRSRLLWLKGPDIMENVL